MGVGSLARRGAGGIRPGLPGLRRPPSGRALTSGLVGLYGLYRAATERGLDARASRLGMAVMLVGVGVLVSACSGSRPRNCSIVRPAPAGSDLGRFDVWIVGPELLPTLVVREAYGTRARDTDWMDGYYPYHEMNAYMGLIAMALAVVGAGGQSRRDRWTNFWVLLSGSAAC